MVILTYLGGLVAFDCKVPRGLTWYMAANTVIFLVLFLNFYRQAYVKKGKEQQESQKQQLQQEALKKCE